MGTVKKVWNFFTIAQWEEEEQWLCSMARNGWNLVRINGLMRYVFERGTPGEYSYKLDLPDNLEHGMDEQAYCSFLDECGIEVVCKKKQWLYLRKKVADGAFDAKSDTFARLKMTNKAYSYAIRMLSLLLKIFSAMLVVALICQTLFSNPIAVDFLRGITMGVGIGAVFAITVIWIPLVNSLRKKMNVLIEEIGVKH